MLTREDLERVETRLRSEREDALEAMRHFDSERGQTLQDEAGELSVYRFHMADIATEAMEREKRFLLASKEGERLYEIDEALRRLYREPETFGSCSRCGAEIGMDRLMVVPSARLCADCASVSED
jgi:DnaK suppressor protein